MHDTALHTAIRYFGSQKALAKALNISPFRINKWVNRDRRIPFEYAVAIEKLTNGLVNRFELAPHAGFLEKLKIKQSKDK